MAVDERVQNVMKLMEKLGAEFELPEEYFDEVPEEEIIYDWDGGVLDEA